MSEIYTTTVEQDPEDPEGGIITFPDELIAQVGWKEGDTVKWSDNEDGSWTISKVEK